MHNYSDIIHASVPVLPCMDLLHIVISFMIQIFVKDNQGGHKTTVINHIELLGFPLEAISPEMMSTFRRLGGEVGEVCKKPPCMK